MLFAKSSSLNRIHKRNIYIGEKEKKIPVKRELFLIREILRGGSYTSRMGINPFIGFDPETDKLIDFLRELAG